MPEVQRRRVFDECTVDAVERYSFVWSRPMGRPRRCMGPLYVETTHVAPFSQTASGMAPTGGRLERVRTVLTTSATWLPPYVTPTVTTVTTIVGPDGEDMTIESGIKRRPPQHVCDVLSSSYADIRRYTYLSASYDVRFRHERLAVTGLSHASAAGVPGMAPNQPYPRRRPSFASGKQCCSTFMKEISCDTRIVLPCTGFAMFQVLRNQFVTPCCRRLCADAPLSTSIRCPS